MTMPTAAAMRISISALHEFEQDRSRGAEDNQVDAEVEDQRRAERQLRDAEIDDQPDMSEKGLADDEASNSARQREQQPHTDQNQRIDPHGVDSCFPAVAERVDGDTAGCD